MPGFWNRILNVNLSEKETWVTEIKIEEWYSWIGGIGIGAQIFSKNLTRDPFDENSPLIFMTGPLVGTIFPNTGRHEVVGLSPLTGFLGESNSGGYFGRELKKAGYDGIIIKGKSDEPSMIYIKNDDVRIENAKEIWGKDIYSAQEKIKKEGNYKISLIGPAGENMVLFSSIMNDEGRAAGRTGLGAVMGSKKLKAIAVMGNLDVPVYDKKSLLEHSRYVSKMLVDSPVNQGFRNYGSMIWIDAGQGLNDVPAHYFTDHSFPYDKVGSMRIHEMFSIKSYHCANCVIGCGREVNFKGQKVDGPEYETVAALGPLLGNEDPEKIIQWNHLANSLGMDTISLGVLLSGVKFFMENGMVENKELESYFSNNFSGISSLIEKIAYRNGIGEDLSLGLERFSSKYGIPRDYVATVKGMEIPMHDPRAFKLQGLGYATSSRGADHLQAQMYSVDMGSVQEDIGITMGDRWNVNSDERVLSLIRTQDYAQIQNSAIICVYAQIPAGDLIKALNLSTGFDYDPDKIVKIGSSIVDLKREINEKLGLKKENDTLPKIVRKRIDDEPAESEIGDDELNELIERYYKLRKWLD